MLTTTSQIISSFEEYIGDSTALSSFSELELADKIYREILEMSEWEFLKKEATGSISDTNITVPSDFTRLTTQNTIYLGATNKPFTVIPFDERRLYTNQNNIAYYDARQGKFVFTKAQNDTYSFDYIYTPPALTIGIASSNPVFPTRFYYAIVHMMCLDSDIIELSEKARSYAGENMVKAERVINDMKMWNSRLTMVNQMGS
jgi:hypothetical protein